MKKIILSIMTIGLISFASCKKAENAVESATQTVEDTAEEATEAMEETVDQTTDTIEEAVASVPKFESTEAQEYANDYNNFFQEMTEASTSGDSEKLMKLQTKAQEWATKQQDLLKTLSESDRSKLIEWATSLAQASAKN